MTPEEAVALLEDAVRGCRGSWADLGCGSGTFTQALWALLEQPARIMAVDRDRDGIEDVLAWVEEASPNVFVVEADFTLPFDITELSGRLDGSLLANSLHFVAEQEAVLKRVVSALRPGGRVVVVEYDGRPASRWVPYPVSPERLVALASACGLTRPVITATRPSEYGGELYVAWGERE